MKAFQRHLHHATSNQTQSQPHPIPPSIHHPPLPHHELNDSSARSQWVAFPPLPSPPSHTLSSAVKFVSTTFKPFSSDIGASTTSATDNTSQTPYTAPSPPPSRPSLLKRVRTQTAPSARLTLSRKRSKSDVGQTPGQARRIDQAPQPSMQTSMLDQENMTPAALSGSLTSRSLYLRHSQRSAAAYGSSASLASDAPFAHPPRRRADSQTPAGILRHRHHQRTLARAEAPSDRQGLLARSVPASAMPFPSTPVSRCSTPTTEVIIEGHPTRPRAKTIGQSPAAYLKPRSTYLGGVGQYLGKVAVPRSPNKPVILHERRLTPKLTIDVSLCDRAVPQPASSAPAVSGWYNRLLLSPISSASSSVFNFLTNTTAGVNPLVTTEEEEEDTPSEESETQKLEDTVGLMRSAPSREQYPFRSWDF